jgi:hypothetical protein
MKLEKLEGLNEDQIKAKFDKANELKEVLGNYFEKEELEVGVVISVLMSMLIDLMKDTGTPPHHAILMFGTLVAKSYEEDDEENEVDEEVKPNEEKMQWLN